MTGRLELLLRRPVPIALGVLILSVGGTMATARGHLGPALTAPEIALMVVASGAILVAQRAPVVAFATALVVCGLGAILANDEAVPQFLALLVVAYEVGSPGPRARLFAFILATVATFALLTLLVPVEPGEWAWADLAVVNLAGLAAGRIAAVLAARAVARDAIAREEETRARLAYERLRMARDLHDVVSHSISMINVQAGVAVHVMDERPEQAREALVTIKTASRDALRDLRDILGVLRDVDAEEERHPSPRLDGLVELIAGVRGSGVEVTLETDPPIQDLPAQVELTAYRVVQEALTNVVRHAPGASARVSLRSDPAALTVEVTNLASPVSRTEGQTSGAGLGLLGMAERVRAAGGELTTKRTGDGGFLVRARLPLGDRA